MKPLKQTKPYNPFPTDFIRTAPGQYPSHEAADHIIIGKNLRALRIDCGLTQDELATRIGVSFQQLQKIEKAINRLTAVRLARIAKVLNVHPTAFFAGIDGLPEPTDIPKKSVFDALNVISMRDADVVSAYNALPSAKQKNAILNLMRAMAQADEE